MFLPCAIHFVQVRGGRLGASRCISSLAAAKKQHGRKTPHLRLASVAGGRDLAFRRAPEIGMRMFPLSSKFHLDIY